MDEKRMTRSNVGALEGSGEALARAASYSEHSTKAVAGQEVSLFLLRGERNAIPARELCKLCGLSSTRALRLAVERERQNGVLVLSGDLGYFLPSSDPTEAEKEVKRFVARTDRRMLSNRLSVKGAKKYLKSVQCCELEGQTAIAEGGGKDA